MITAIVGAGGFAMDVYHQMLDEDPNREIHLFADEEYCTKPGIYPLNRILTNMSEVYVCIADPNIRKHMVSKLPKNTNYGTYIHKSVQIHDKKNFHIGEGSIICAGSIITSNVLISKHCHIGHGSIIGHDAVINDYTSIMPRVTISGNCRINENVYIGTGAMLREKTTIAKQSVIGMGAVVIKDIKTPQQMWVGVPAKQLK